MSAYTSYVNVSPDLVASSNLAVWLPMVVRDLDAQCPDGRLRRLAEWEAFEIDWHDEYGPFHVYRVVVRWPEVDHA